MKYDGSCEERELLPCERTPANGPHFGFGEILFCRDQTECKIEDFTRYLFEHESNPFNLKFQEDVMNYWRQLSSWDNQFGFNQERTDVPARTFAKMIWNIDRVSLKRKFKPRDCKIVFDPRAANWDENVPHAKTINKVDRLNLFSKLIL